MTMFDSKDTRFKTPFGAVSTDEKITINFFAEKRREPKGVFMVIRGALSARIELEKVREDGEYIHYSTEFSVPSAGIAYFRFEISTDYGFLFVGRDREGKAIIGDWLPEWQLTVYEKGYSTPEWIKGGLIYHIFADRFARVEDNRKPRFGYLKGWNEDVEVHKEDGSYDADDFFGGNIKGILSRLDYLESLGVTAIYLSPIFESSSNHRYDTGDYFKVDGLFGTEEEFKRLIDECRSRGIGIILDGVFNHTGWDSIYFNKFGRYPSLGAYQSPSSPYHDWFSFYHFPDGYACWWGVKNVPSVKRDSKGFQDFIAGRGGVIDKWASLGVSGWRLDVVDELSSDFVKRIRCAVKRHGEESLVIGEVWEDASTKVSYGERREYLLGKELDGVMNYPFRTAILAFVKGGPAEDFCAKVNEIIENYPKQSLDCCMTLIGTHDTVRAVTELAGVPLPHTKKERRDFRLAPEQYAKAKKRLMTAAAIQYFLPGVPSLYYGDETALEGCEDPMNRRPYPWGSQDKETVEFYKKLGQIRKKYRPDFIAHALAKAEGGLLKIERPSLVLYANSSPRPAPIAPSYDLLSGKTVYEVAPGEAVICTRQ
jgi:glycosidase